MNSYPVAPAYRSGLPRYTAPESSAYSSGYESDDYPYAMLAPASRHYAQEDAAVEPDMFKGFIELFKAFMSLDREHPETEVASPYEDESNALEAEIEATYRGLEGPPSPPSPASSRGYAVAPMPMPAYPPSQPGMMMAPQPGMMMPAPQGYAPQPMPNTMMMAPQPGMMMPTTAVAEGTPIETMTPQPMMAGGFPPQTSPMPQPGMAMATGIPQPENALAVGDAATNIPSAGIVNGTFAPGRQPYYGKGGGFAMNGQAIIETPEQYLAKRANPLKRDQATAGIAPGMTPNAIQAGGGGMPWDTFTQQALVNGWVKGDGQTLGSVGYYVPYDRAIDPNTNPAVPRFGPDGTFSPGVINMGVKNMGPNGPTDAFGNLANPNVITNPNPLLPPGTITTFPPVAPPVQQQPVVIQQAQTFAQPVPFFDPAMSGFVPAPAFF